MLEPELVQEVERHVREYPSRRSACIEALKAVQRHHRWVSDEHLADLAGLLEMTPAELDGVATFYSLVFRKPVGEHVILVCDSVSCWICDGRDIHSHLERRLGIRMGQTTPDGLFTLLTIPCLGACDQAPAMMVDQTLHGRLTPDRVDDILAELTRG